MLDAWHPLVGVWREVGDRGRGSLVAFEWREKGFIEGVYVVPVMAYGASTREREEDESEDRGGRGTGRTHERPSAMHAGWAPSHGGRREGQSTAHQPVARMRRGGDGGRQRGGHSSRCARGCDGSKSDDSEGDEDEEGSGLNLLGAYGGEAAGSDGPSSSFQDNANPSVGILHDVAHTPSADVAVARNAECGILRVPFMRLFACIPQCSSPSSSLTSPHSSLHSTCAAHASLRYEPPGVHLSTDDHCGFGTSAECVADVQWGAVAAAMAACARSPLHREAGPHGATPPPHRQSLHAATSPAASAASLFACRVGGSSSGETSLPAALQEPLDLLVTTLPSSAAFVKRRAPSSLSSTAAAAAAVTCRHCEEGMRVCRQRAWLSSRLSFVSSDHLTLQLSSQLWRSSTQHCHVTTTTSTSQCSRGTVTPTHQCRGERLASPLTASPSIPMAIPSPHPYPASAAPSHDRQSSGSSSFCKQSGWVPQDNSFPRTPSPASVGGVGGGRRGGGVSAGLRRKGG